MLGGHLWEITNVYSSISVDYQPTEYFTNINFTDYVSMNQFILNTENLSPTFYLTDVIIYPKLWFYKLEWPISFWENQIFLSYISPMSKYLCWGQIPGNHKCTGLVPNHDFDHIRHLKWSMSGYLIHVTKGPTLHHHLIQRFAFDIHTWWYDIFRAEWLSTWSFFNEYQFPMVVHYERYDLFKFLDMPPRYTIAPPNLTYWFSEIYKLTPVNLYILPSIPLLWVRYARALEGVHSLDPNWLGYTDILK